MIISDLSDSLTGNAQRRILGFHDGSWRRQRFLPWFNAFKSVFPR
jgi:hypothetical protein